MDCHADEEMVRGGDGRHKGRAMCRLARIFAQGRKGHRSGNIGEETVTLLVIELDVTPTVDQPCRFK
jgi:hypothetical protein